MTTIAEAKKIMKNNFIGPEELESIADDLNISNKILIGHIPIIPFSQSTLKTVAKDYILILGVSKTKDKRPMTINSMRNFFGSDPKISEPCLYNQDWYIKENFFNKTILSDEWYLIRKNVKDNTRGKDPQKLSKILKSGQSFPPAVLTVFTFFAYFFHTEGKVLWKHDFIWCSDCDNNGDIVYVGRYKDPKKNNKNGFNIHRHLSIRPCYGLADVIK